MKKVIKTIKVEGRYAKGKDVSELINYILFSKESAEYRTGMVDALKTLNLITLAQQKNLLDNIKEEA